MPKGLSYADAVRLLGGSGPAVAALDRVLGGALLVASALGAGAALSLLDAKSEIVRLGQTLVSTVGRHARGIGRVDRTERLRAAHSVIVVANLFDGLDLLDLPISLKDVELTRQDQAAMIAGDTRTDGWLDNIISAPIPAPGAALCYDDLLVELKQWYSWHSNRFLDYLKGLAIWDGLDETGRRRVIVAFRERLPDKAVRGYQNAYLKLAAEVPEFAIWAWRMDQHATGAQLRRVSVGLSELEALLRGLTSAGPPAGNRAALATAYRDALSRPIAGADQHTVDLTIPSLGEMYIDPRFTARAGTVNDNPADQSWWEGSSVRADLPTFLAAHLTTAGATQAPLVLLGQPGAGKSALTRVLAARLPPEDFMPVRVPLRDVPADVDVQEQIEYAVRAATGERISWPDLSRSADGALPVVLLDGLDELLQAIGVSQSNYLQRIAEFQRREAVQQRPVAVVVTTRTAVADRARLAEGSVVVKLEPFDEQQIDGWLAVWNAANAEGFARRQMRPLPGAVAARYRDLAGHPLLLVMLALYDAHDNALQAMQPTGAPTSRLNRAHLYERLLSTFAGREVRRRHNDGISDADLLAAVEDELLRLSVVAFAMFNRSRSWTTEAELDRDFAALSVPPPVRATDADLQTPASSGQEMIGRFFFIQGTAVLHNRQHLHTFEFLHGTFGEFLVARLITRVLHDLADREAASSLWLRSVDDPLLYALLSFTPLCAEGSTVLLFLAELLAAGATPRDQVSTWLLRAFHTATGRLDVPRDDYLPLPVPAGQRLTRFTVNLVVLAVVCGGRLEAKDLFPKSADPAGRLGRLANSWQAVLPREDWDALLDTTVTRRSWSDQTRNAALSLANEGDQPQPVDALWIHAFGSESFIGKFGPGRGFNKWVSTVRVERAQQLRGDQGDDVFRHALAPMLDRLPHTVDAFATHCVGDAESVAQSLQRVLLSSALGDAADTLVAVYDRCVFAVVSRAWGPGHSANSSSTIALVLEMLGRDAPRLPVTRVHTWLVSIVRSRQFLAVHLAAALDCALALAPDSPTDRLAQTDLVQVLLDQAKAGSEIGPPVWNARTVVLLWVTLHEAGAGELAEAWLGADAGGLAALSAAGAAVRYDRALTARLQAIRGPA